jgi:hypothetical protein
MDNPVFLLLFFLFLPEVTSVDMAMKKYTGRSSFLVPPTFFLFDPHDFHLCLHHQHLSKIIKETVLSSFLTLTSRF